MSITCVARTHDAGVWVTVRQRAVGYVDGVWVCSVLMQTRRGVALLHTASHFADKVGEGAIERDDLHCSTSTGGQH
eukprot:9676-Pyramimonas_sp.AAC.1